MKLRPYMSIDIETTGLDIRKSEILSIGIVIDDGVSDFNSLRKKEIFIKLPDFDHQEAEALQINQYLISRIERGEVFSYGPREALDLLKEEIKKTIAITRDFDNENGLRPSNKITVAGKNVLSFDIATIYHFFKRHVGANEASIFRERSKNNCIAHRAIDVGSLYFSSFGYVPSSEELHNHLGVGQVAHQALADAKVMVKAVRNVFK